MRLHAVNVSWLSPRTLLIILIAGLLTPLAANAQSGSDESLTTARELLAAKKSDQAITLLQAVLRTDPKNAIIHNELGVAFFQRKDLANASRAFEAAVAADAELAHGWANLAEARRLSGNFRKAALAFHRFLTLRKGDRYGLYGLSLSFEGYEAYDKALRTLSLAERESQDDRPLLARINRARLRLQEKIREADLPVLIRGDARFVSGRFKAAAAIYTKGVKAYPNNASLRGRLGLTLAVMGDLVGGIRQLRAALSLDPAEPVANFAYARLATAKPDSVESTVSKLLENDRAALALSTTKPSPTVERSEAQLRMGQLDNAYLSAPKKADGAKVRAEIHVLRGEWAEAESELKETITNPKEILLLRRSLLTY